MTLLAGDLTTPARLATWLGTAPSGAIGPQLISSMSALIYSKLNRARTYSQTFTRTFDGAGTYQIVLPDYPVTAVSAVQMGAVNVQLSPLPQGTNSIIPPNSFGFGYRFVPWAGNLPGDPSVLEFVNGCWWPGVQNIRVTYTAGYLIADEAWTIPASPPYTATVLQPQGLWCRDNGITLQSTGVALTPITSGSPAVNQYLVPPDATPGLYAFNSANAGDGILISYSFVPADLEEACIQMVAERYSYRTRVGDLAKSLGGQETMRYIRGGNRGQMFPDLPPEVEGLIWPYVSVAPPAIGAPV